MEDSDLVSSTCNNKLNMTQPLFSILVANYNNGRFFKDCYDSIMLQTYTDWEVIIVDDCSTDNSLEIITQLTEGDSRFKLFVNDKNEGCGYTKRRCLEKAEGELVGFLDPDDALTLNAVEAMVCMHEKHSEASLVHSNFVFCDEMLRERRVVKGQYREEQEYLKTNLYIHAFISFKLSAYRQTEGINPCLRRSVDQDLYYKLEEIAPFVYLDKVLYKYRIHIGGISTTTNELKATAWHLYVLIDTCKRRNESVEDILPIHMANRNYNVGKMVLKPLRLLRGVLSQIKTKLGSLFRIPHFH